MKQEFRSIGLMSGTSLDGLDICYVRFYRTNDVWSFAIEAATTVKYTSEWEQALSTAQCLSAIDFVELHTRYGKFLGEQVVEFMRNNSNLQRPDFVSSHGHTIFHQPQRNITWQIGSGAALAAACGITTVNDFRSLDVALCGQGAPLVPIGDELLFNDYAACLNLGGFANISFSEKGKRVAYDICPVNIVLNALAARCGCVYDNGGQLAAKGQVHQLGLDALNNLPFYTQNGPKSLGREWVEKAIWPVLDSYDLDTCDALRTFVEHIAQRIAVASTGVNGTMLVTGGGAYNSFLIDCMRRHISCKIEVPEPLVVEFKEALIFAFLGLLRITESINSLSSVTGAHKDSCGGAVYLA